MMGSLFALFLATFLAACSSNPTSARLDIEYPTNEDPSGVMSRFDKDRMYYNCTRYGGLNEGSIYQISSQRWSYKCDKHPSLLKENKKITQIQTQTQTLNIKEDLKSIKIACTNSGFKSGTEEFGKCVDTKIKGQIKHYGQCIDYGGVNDESIKQISNDVWSYKCRSGSDLPSSKEESKKIQSQSVNLSGNINGAKLRCTDLGFKTGTEDFGKCVLQLSK